MNLPKLLLRKINNLLARGKLLSMDVEDKKVPTIKAGLMASEIWDELEYPQDFGFKSFAPFESDDDTETTKKYSVEVQAAFFGGNRNHGTILKAFIRRLMPDLEPGETVVYNAFGMSVKINKDSEIVITKIDLDDSEADPQTFNIKFNDDGDIAITSTANIVLDVPTVTITGDLVVDGTINGI